MIVLFVFVPATGKETVRMRSNRPALLTLLAPVSVAALLFLSGLPAEAHWCSNIWTATAKLVVKPERTTVYLSSSPTKLRVYLQSNFPYRLYGIEMRGNASGYTTTVTPSSQDALPGQNVSFVLTITATSAGSVSTSTLGIQVRFRPGAFPYTYGWQGLTDCMPKTSPTQTELLSGANPANYGASYCNDSNQALALNAGTLVDRYPTATLPSSAPTFSRTGMQELIHMFGYRFCWSSSGSWRCGTSDCPTSCSDLGSGMTAWSTTDQWPQNCMRAGAELAARKASLGSDLTAARNGAINALKGLSGGGSPEHKCLAALVGGFLWQGASSTTTYTSALNDSANAVSASCISVGLRALQGGTALSCSSMSTYYEQAVCAAAEGLQGSDTYVKSILIAQAGDGNNYGPSKGSPSDGYTSLYNAYMLLILSGARKASYGYVSYYPDAGLPLIGDGTPVTPEASTKPDSTVVKLDAKKADTTVVKLDTTVVKVDSKKADTAVVKADTRRWDTVVVKTDAKKTDTGSVVKNDTAATDGHVGIDAVTETGPTTDISPAGENGPVGDGLKHGEAKTGGQLDGGCGCVVAAPSLPGRGLPGLLVVVIGVGIFVVRTSRRKTLSARRARKQKE
jgi:hypothetical protein